MPQELLDPQSKTHQENPLWLRPGETPEQYRARTAMQPTAQPVSLDEAETPMPPTFEPTQRVEDTISLQAQLERQRKELEDSYQRQLDDIERQRKEQERIQEEQRKKQEGILGQLETQTTPFREDLERTERQRLQVEQNFFANQALVNELDKLLTESTSLMRQLQTQRVPGLAGLQQSDRMIKAYETAQSRIAIVEAVMSARNNQIGTALTFIDRTKGAIQQDRQDRINYLESLFNFYETTRNEAGEKIFNLTKDEKDIINAQRRLLERDLERTEETAQRIKDLMLENPQMVAEAGISLNDTEAEISKKLADWQYVQEVRGIKNEMQEKGIKEISPEQAKFKPSNEIFTYVDSKGNEILFHLSKEFKTQIIGGFEVLTDNQGNLITQRQLKEGVGSSDRLSSLSQAVIDNPNLFNTLTSTRKGEVIQELTAAGYNLESLGGKPLSDTAIKELTQTRSAIENLNSLKDIIQDNLQYVGPITGLSAINPWSPARRTQADIDRVRQIVGKALEGGVLRKEDEEKYKKILAKITDTPETAIYKLNQLIADIQGDIDDYIMLQEGAGRNLNIKESLSIKGQSISGTTSGGNSYTITEE